MIFSSREPVANRSTVTFLIGVDVVVSDAIVTFKHLIKNEAKVTFASICFATQIRRHECQQQREKGSKSNQQHRKRYTEPFEMLGMPTTVVSADGLLGFGYDKHGESKPVLAARTLVCIVVSFRYDLTCFFKCSVFRISSSTSTYVRTSLFEVKHSISTVKY